MSPLPGWTVIPPDWAQHHQPVSEGTMTALGAVHRATEGPPPYPLPPGWTGTEVIWDDVYFRVQERAQRAGELVVADQPTTQRQYLVTAPLGGPALRAGENGDIVHVLGRKLRIIDIMDGSLLWELDLICVDNLTQQNP